MMTISASAQFYIYFSDGTVAKVDSISMIAPGEPEEPDTPTEPEEPATPSTGIGVFSVSAYGRVVTFSPGNLQYTQSTNTWSFAKNQWDYIGTDNVIGGSVSSDPTFGDSKEGTALADKIDLFGWSTNTTNFGVNTSTDVDFILPFIDWGTNKIGNDTPNTWCTLTSAEWYYILYNRTNADDLVGVAQVNGVNGLILLPDNWECPASVTFKSGFHSEWGAEAYGQYQTFTVEQWLLLESAGAVFLPAAGDRDGLFVDDSQLIGTYWGASWYLGPTPESNGRDVCQCQFYSNEPNIFLSGCRGGRSVRLVKDVTPETPENPDTPTEPEEPDDRPDESENDTLLNNFTLGDYGFFGSPEMIAGTDTTIALSDGDYQCQLGLISLYAWDDNIVYTGQGFSGMGLFFVADLPVWWITAGDYAGYCLANSTGFYIDSVMTAYTAEAGQLVDLQAYGDGWKALLAAKTQEDSIAAAELIYGAQTGSQFYHMDFNTGVQSYYYGNVKYANIVEDNSLGLLFDLKLEWYDNMNPNRCYGLATKEVDGATVLVEPYDMHVINKEYSNRPTEEKSLAVSAKKTAKNNSVSGKISKLHPMKKIDFPMPMRKVIR